MAGFRVDDLLPPVVLFVAGGLVRPHENVLCGSCLSGGDGLRLNFFLHVDTGVGAGE